MPSKAVVGDKRPTGWNWSGAPTKAPRDARRAAPEGRRGDGWWYSSGLLARIQLPSPLWPSQSCRFTAQPLHGAFHSPLGYSSAYTDMPVTEALVTHLVLRLSCSLLAIHSLTSLNTISIPSEYTMLARQSKVPNSDFFSTN